MTCTHLLCELIGGDCSIAVNRSRGCHAGGWARTVASGVFDEVRALLAAIDTRDRSAAVRLAQIVRAEALEERNVLAHAREDDPELAELLAPLVVRRDRGRQR
jgi:hypothetical protein